MELIDFPLELEKTRDINDIFELVKLAVEQVMGAHRAGLMLGLADLGEGKYAWIGGYHVVSSNAIIMNIRPLNSIKKMKPEWYKSYAFHVLTHEYVHTLGIYDERTCRAQTLEIMEELFGNHLVTEMAKDMRKLIPEFRTVNYGWSPSKDPNIYFVDGFDRSSTTYFV